MCGRYSEHLVSPFIYAMYEFGYWGNVRCVFHIGSSGPILGIANRYYGYEIRNQLSVEWQGPDFREFGYTGSSDDIFGCWIAVTICVSGARHNIIVLQGNFEITILLYIPSATVKIIITTILRYPSLVIASIF
jgi:hypothetical protein